MNTFTWLLVGHFLGDWILQNDWMARGKKQALLTRAGIVHFSIYTTTTVGALWLAHVNDEGPMFYLIVGLIIFVSHWLIDSTNVVAWWMRFYHQSHMESVRVMVDQLLHILVLVLVTTLILRN